MGLREVEVRYVDTVHRCVKKLRRPSRLAKIDLPSSGGRTPSAPVRAFQELLNRMRHIFLT
jgi:hypothetical protein